MKSQPTFKMTSKQEAHLKRIKDEFSALSDAKFRAGAEEHQHEQKDLETVPAIKLIDFAIEEAIDQVVYLVTLKERLNDES